MSFPLDLKAPHNFTFLSPLVLALTFRPDGVQLAVASLDAQITFWDIARRVLFLLRVCTVTPKFHVYTVLWGWANS
jgi:WD40 repeat protein